jgi:hypothetical protein
MMAAVMGADEYGFGSVAMIATGCVMARICHTNNCPVGVASQVPMELYMDLHTVYPFSDLFFEIEFPLERRTTCSVSWHPW